MAYISQTPNRRQAIIWTNADPIHLCIYAALGGDELKVQEIYHMNPLGANYISTTKHNITNPVNILLEIMFMLFITAQRYSLRAFELRNWPN